MIFSIFKYRMHRDRYDVARITRKDNKIDKHIRIEKDVKMYAVIKRSELDDEEEEEEDDIRLEEEEEEEDDIRLLLLKLDVFFCSN